MCDMLYLAIDRELPLCAYGPVTVEAIESARDAKLRPSFSRPFRRLVTADGNCSCGFPSFPFQMGYFDGMFQGESEEERAESVAIVRRLLELVEEALRSSSVVEAYFSYFDQEGLPPKGRLSLRVRDVVPERFFFVERYLYEFRAE